MTALTNKTRPAPAAAGVGPERPKQRLPAFCNRWPGRYHPTSQIPDRRADLSGIVVDINLRSAESVRGGNKLRSEAYREMPRLSCWPTRCIMVDAAWALGATAPSRGRSMRRASCKRIRAAFPEAIGYDEKPIAAKP